MNKIQATSLAIIALPLLLVTTSSQASMDPTLEKALVKICKAASSNIPLKLKDSISDYHLTERKVALNVMCNGNDIISFAEQHYADKTANRLKRSVGQVSISDVAAISNINVTFKE
ncbi:DUF3718 domain-containing protein [Colwelliaceae bacterium 6471]